MVSLRVAGVVALLCVVSGLASGADIILNEYNAVDSNDFFNGGDAAADRDGGRAFDSYFGRVQGNGGDWFELVVIKDHLDIRGWHLDILVDSVFDETLDLSNDPIWSDLRSGTIITVAEDIASDISYDPAAGDWWINVQSRDDADGAYITASSFPVNSNNWQLRVRSVSGAVIFGPAGEGIHPASGVGGTNVFLLERSPDANVTPDSNDYDDGVNFSTFGAPNRWGLQDFSDLRTVAPAPASMLLLSPDGNDVLAAGAVVPILWETQGAVDKVLVEFSLDGGVTWQAVYPPNAGNSGRYDWAVPDTIGSDQCLIRVSSATRLAIADASDQLFAIVQCGLEADINGDCMVNFFDFVIMASQWLQ